MARILIALIMTLFLSGCASLHPSVQPQTDSFDPHLLIQQPLSKIPLRDAGNLQWHVQVEIDGVTGWFAVDTGSETTILSPQFAEKIERLKNTGTNGTKLSRKLTQADRFSKIVYLRLGGILYLDFYAPIINLDHINHAMHPPIDGILGNNIFSRTACSFDWKRNQLTLDTDSPMPPSNAISISIVGHRIFLTAEANQTPAEFMLDTGAFCCCLKTNEILHLKIPSSKIKQIKAQQIDITQSRMSQQTELKLDSFRLGKIQRTDLPMRTWEQNVLGMDLLQSWVLTFDARSNWMSLTESGASPLE